VKLITHFYSLPAEGISIESKKFQCEKSKKKKKSREKKANGFEKKNELNKW
jgi:hypothetical protein